MPSNNVDFSSLTAFKRNIKCVDFSDFLNFTYFFRTGIVSLTFVLLMFLFYFILLLFLGRQLVLYLALSHLSYAICSSCTLCCMCSWQINDDDDDDINSPKLTYGHSQFHFFRVDISAPSQG